MATITINGNSFDPVAQKTELMDVGLESVDTSTSDYILLQATDPLTKDQKAELKSRGVTILEYVADDSYIAYYPPKDLTPIKQLTFLVWAGLYPKQVKVEPVLRSQSTGGVSPRVVNALTPRFAADPLEHQPKTVEVILHRNVQPDA